jgi:hypothetical protein
VIRNQYRRTTLTMTATVTLLALASPAQAAAKTPSAAAKTTISAARGGVAVRSGPTSASARVGTLTNRARITPICQVVGQRVKGRVRTTSRWDLLGAGRYVSDAYVSRSKAVPLCPPPPPPPPPAPAAPAPAAPGPATRALAPSLPPITGGTPVGIWVQPVPGHPGSGYRTASRPDHDGVDIMMPRETPIHATADGTVVTVVCNTSGPSCDIDGSPAIRGCGWYVEIRHASNVITRYCHMIRQPSVVVGQQVTPNQIIGYVGTSGNSSGPHLHFEVHAGSPATRANAVDPLDFMRRAGAPIS